MIQMIPIGSQPSVTPVNTFRKYLEVDIVVFGYWAAVGSW